MKKFRQRILEIKEGFLSGKCDESYPAYMLANSTFIFVIFLISYTISAIVHNYFKIVGGSMLVISIILFFVFEFSDRAFSKTIKYSGKIFTRIFGRYGKVVRKDDWKRIKKKNRDAYKFIWDKNNIGHCYMVAWVLSLWIEDAKLMYCSVKRKQGDWTAHAVVVKNNCVYDTNLRNHYDYDEYIKIFEAEVYQIFEEETYCKKSFFDDVRQGFKEWCAERNVYCDPQ